MAEKNVSKIKTIRDMTFLADLTTDRELEESLWFVDDIRSAVISLGLTVLCSSSLSTVVYFGKPLRVLY